MGGRRKTKTVIVNQKEKCQTNWTWNCSVTARNLRKSDLAGVIFGCKHRTIRECLKEGLFGEYFVSFICFAFWSISIDSKSMKYPFSNFFVCRITSPSFFICEEH